MSNGTFSEPSLFLPKFKVHVGRVFPGNPQTYIAVCPRIVGIVCHWIDDAKEFGTDRPHHPDPRLCLGCKRRLAKKWKPYLGVWDTFTERLILLGLSVQAWRYCPLLRVEEAVNLRGREIQVARLGNTNKAPIKASVGGHVSLPYRLHDPFDEVEALARLFQVERDGIVLADSPP